MEKLFNKLETINKHWKTLIAFVGIFVALITLIWGLFSRYDELMDKNDEILDNLETTQQMALKAVIWNDNIPISERASVCDVYLEKGYNSLTKKLCERITNQFDSSIAINYDDTFLMEE